MKNQASVEPQRDLLDRKLTELALLAKRLCPGGLRGGTPCQGLRVRLAILA